MVNKEGLTHLKQFYINSNIICIPLYRESRKAIREMVKNNVIVYVKADIETCKKDTKGNYEKASKGEYQNFYWGQ